MLIFPVHTAILPYIQQQGKFTLLNFRPKRLVFIIFIVTLPFLPLFLKYVYLKKKKKKK